MRYEPIDKLDIDRAHVGKYWTEQKKKNFQLLLATQSINGQVSQNTFKSFEYWFGKNAEEFNKMLAYPKLSKLLKRKKGFSRK